MHDACVRTVSPKTDALQAILVLTPHYANAHIIELFERYCVPEGIENFGTLILFP